MWRDKILLATLKSVSKLSCIERIYRFQYIRDEVLQRFLFCFLFRATAIFNTIRTIS